ncbi:helix-turn-helix domain-containing protein [Marinobacter sp. JSM 1782161]|uniref:helix-turn-helix domain-containing protein n=1 Tax=Marinobacter sp. JSM 1782161 TaxID=2685906 RepID=UPI00140364A5|nr:helix-turn-helix domain-containing protein [Marinobacter sp. JSM 1782161]
MDQLYMPACIYAEGFEAFHGDVACLNTPMGVEFARISGSPFKISGKSEDQPYSMWLALLLEGDFALHYQGLSLQVEAGDLIYAPTGVDMSLSMASDFTVLYIKIPQDMLHSRLLNPSLIDVGYIPRDQAAYRVFTSMLESLSQHLDEIDATLLRPVEIAISEFLITTLIQQSKVQEFGSTAKMLHFRRICQHIDNHLSDPALSLGTVADQCHVSARYVQKLFETSGDSFVHYVRIRRLERCRCELGNPEYDHLSVSDICFRWGFNDAAHFSRVFRKAFGMTPREYRRKSSAALAS